MKTAPTKVKKKATFAKMDMVNKAMCYALRHPPAGGKKVAYNDIIKMVKKSDGTRPTIGAVHEAVQMFKEQKGGRGRPQGTFKTTKEEDKVIVNVFKKLRPPGCGVDSRGIHTALPQNLKKKICRKTIIRRLASKGYTAQKKLQKSDPGIKLQKKRVAFGDKHRDKNAQHWKSYLQGAGDVKEFTFYPKELQGRFRKLRAPWTYMTKKEKHQPAFVRPKRWFPKKDYKKTRKQKVFGLTTSNGKTLAFLVPKPWSTEQWAASVRKRVAPFLKKAFPGLTSYNILLDGEALLHGPPAKAAFRAGNITIMPGWPKYSPDLNPQENVWAWAEKHLRELETGRDTFAVWQKKTLKAVNAYPSAGKLIASMAKRCQALRENKGAMLDK